MLHDPFVPLWSCPVWVLLFLLSGIDGVVYQFRNTALFPKVQLLLYARADVF